MTRSETGTAVAQLLFEAGAIAVSPERPFFLAAGWASPVYVDCRLLYGEPDARRTLMDLAARAVADLSPVVRIDAVAGAETAGIPFAASLAERLELRFRYVRKRPLGIGRNAQVEGGSVDGLRILLVDDLTTDGESKLKFARGLRAAGAVVEHVLTIFDHATFPGAKERLHAADLTLHALATWSDVLDAAQAHHMTAVDRRTVETFLSDPVGWSNRHGGRGQAEPPR
jgi:orotate phosphoribosyltransferase